MSKICKPVLKTVRKSQKAAQKELQIAQRNEQLDFEQYLNLGSPKKVPEPIQPQHNQLILGRWTQSEHQDYIKYLQEFKTLKKQIFVQLAKKIPSRSQSQIRAHHQKLLRRFGTIEGIIECHSSTSVNIINAVKNLSSVLSKLKIHFKENEDFSTDLNL